MRGVVVHYAGKIRRALEGAGNGGRLEVSVINSLSSRQAATPFGYGTQRPIYFVFNFDGRPFAASKNVVLIKGRRYPDVEHWFILPDRKQKRESHEVQQTSATPAIA